MTLWFMALVDLIRRRAWICMSMDAGAVRTLIVAVQSRACSYKLYRWLIDRSLMLPVVVLSLIHGSSGQILSTLNGTASNAGICSHPDREDIERDFVGWRSPAEIAKAYHLGNRSTVYRHAQALGLFPKRQRNVRAALERIIEQAGSVQVTAASVVVGRAGLREDRRGGSLD